MYRCLLKNSYVVAVIAFIVAWIVCMIFDIGYTQSVKNGRIVRRFGWRYPLAIALMVWVAWHYWISPPNGSKSDDHSNHHLEYESPAKTMMDMCHWY